MDAPIKPRYAYVDAQLNTFEEELADAILTAGYETSHWAATGAVLVHQRINLIAEHMYRAFEPITLAYQNYSEVTDCIDHAVFLLQNCIFVGMNVPAPLDPQHTAHVCANVMDIYNRMIYAGLRTEMIMANHHCEVIQRNWRRCITDPEHPACKRRLECDFEQLKLSSV